MKQVTKDVSPREFEDWKARGNEDWQPSYGILRNPEKRALHESLLAEQGWVCCYCGRSVTLDDSHIEHFRPQERYRELALNYENLHASCLRETEPGRPLHCGHAKGADFDEELHVSPLSEDCERRFLYTLDGRIILGDPADTGAAYMLDLLKLDIAFLRNRRQEEVGRVFDPQFLATVTGEELRLLGDFYRHRDEHGRMPSFGHVLARFAEQRLADSRA
jgi:uncharacterized protein (TIGR02646 family)